jgi:hypothetical protein
LRLVKKKLTDIPPPINYSTIGADIHRIANGNKSAIKDTVYKGAYKDAAGKAQSIVREHLNKYYLTKCAYCEMHCKGEIEHYRPKLGIIEDSTHDGYYWLCYEWSNLVPACRYCNTEGGKGNQFPLIDSAKRVKTPNLYLKKLNYKRCSAAGKPLLGETAFLLHPEIDNPKKFFTFNLRPGNDGLGIDINGLDNLKRGEQSILICNLNRTYLRLNRLESVFYAMRQPINLVFDFIANKTIAKKDIGKALKSVFNQFNSDKRNKKLTHTLLRWFIIDSSTNFENYFAPYIENKEQRKIVVEAFKKFKAQTL